MKTYNSKKGARKFKDGEEVKKPRKLRKRNALEKIIKREQERRMEMRREAYRKRRLISKPKMRG